MEHCKLCRLHEGCKSVKVPARGSEQPKFLWVGQAPGREEDEKNTCFVGPAGQLLTQAIKEYDFKPSRLTNLCRCFPPGDRAPRADEIKACKPYLMEEIEKYKPEFIIALGNHPLRALTGKNGIMDYSGRVVGEIVHTPVTELERFNPKVSKIFALYHPSFILRMERMLPKFEMHLRALQDMAKNVAADDLKVEVVDPLTAVQIFHIGHVKDPTEIVSFDYETTGQYKVFGGKIRCVSFHYSGRTFVVKADEPGFKEFMTAFLSMTMPKSAFNSIFERRWSIEEFGVDPVNLIYDPMVMHYLLDENGSHDLESVAGEYLGVGPWAVEALMKDNGWTYETIPMEHLVPYTGKDAYYTAELTKKFLERKDEFWKLYKGLLLPITKLCTTLEMRGLQLDIVHADKVTQSYRKDCAKLRKKLIESLKLPDDFNPGSSQQVAEVVQKKLKIRTGVRTKAGAMSVKEEALLPFEDTVPWIKTYLEWTKKTTLITDFLGKFIHFTDKHGLIHPNYVPTQVTGRPRVKEPPAANVPKDKQTRGMIVSRFEGGKILSSDFDQLEMRLLASESGEASLLDLFARGGDPHDDTAVDVFGDKFTDEERKLAKEMNFSGAYGIQAYSLARKFNLSESFAEDMLFRFWKSKPALYQWMIRTRAFAKEHEYLTNRFGRVRRFPGVREMGEKMFNRVMRQAGNFPIQSQGSDINYIAAILLDKHLREMQMRSLVVLIQHDSNLVDTYPGEEATVMEWAVWVMEEEIKTYAPWLQVQLKVSQELSKRWGGLN